jgi:hypothetical protein
MLTPNASKQRQTFDVVNDMAYADAEGKVFDSSFPAGH